MQGRLIGRVVGTAATAGIVFVMSGAPVVLAHPLGNFSVNRAHNLTFRPESIVDRAVVDFAEIPTAQAEGRTDLDSDGQISTAEFSARAQSECSDLLTQVTLMVDSAAVPMSLTDSSFSYLPGQAGLPTGRLECRLEAAVDLTVPRQVSLVDEPSIDRVGWREITATGDGVRLIDSPVPQVSTSDELRSYPVDLLNSPLDVREVVVAVQPGDAAVAPAPVDAERPTAERSLVNGGPLAGVVDRVTERFNDLVGRRDLTLSVGLLAVALAMILGASHALLPGHGKTVMAAYIAGRQGSARDAVVVGATVTATHTGGVLILGLALTVSSSLAGESVLRWLGLASGLMIATLGASLLVGAIRHRVPAHGHRHSFGGHTHTHDDPDHDHGHGHGHSHGTERSPRRSVASTRILSSATLRHPVRAVQQDDHVVDGISRTSVATINRAPAAPRSSSINRSGPRLPVKFSPAPSTPQMQRASSSSSLPGPTVISRRGLIGMGVAGGLVPSPSALIVLLSAIALGRTAFGVILVIGYGLGMAATLTLAGLLLVRIRDRYQRRATSETGRFSAFARRWTAVTPYATALLVVVVGVGIAARALTSI